MELNGDEETIILAVARAVIVRARGLNVGYKQAVTSLGDNDRCKDGGLLVSDDFEAGW